MPLISRGVASHFQGHRVPKAGEFFTLALRYLLNFPAMGLLRGPPGGLLLLPEKDFRDLLRTNSTSGLDRAGPGVAP